MSTTGSRHRDRKTTGNVLNHSVNTGLTKYFFGEEGTGKLTSDEFVNFKNQLQKEVMYLEVWLFNSTVVRNTQLAFTCSKSAMCEIC